VVRYPVYLEIADDGRCLAHGLDLPGCIVRAPTREEALRQLPEAVLDYRHYLLARLASERAGLLAQILYLDREALTSEIVHGEWTTKDILAHAAAWDRWGHRTMQSIAEGGEPDFAALDDCDASNAAFVAAQRDYALEGVLAELQAARAAWIAWLDGLPEEAFYRVRSCGGYDWTFSNVPLRAQWEHDAHHAERIANWRKAQNIAGRSGPKTALLAALAAARDELLAAAALVPPEERSSVAVCGAWMLKDVAGHIADWENLGAAGLRQMADGRAPFVEHITDIDAWNAAHAEARRDQPREQVWEDLIGSRRALVETLAVMSQADLERSFAFPWGPEGTPYQWVGVYVDHDRSHARGLRGEKDTQ